MYIALSSFSLDLVIYHEHDWQQTFYLQCFLFHSKNTVESTSGSRGGGAPGARPPLTAADLRFFMHKTLSFHNFFFARD